MAFDRTHECWLFPEALFGSRPSVGKKWDRIVARAIEAGNWSEPLEKIPRKCVLDDSTDISISEGCRMFPAARSMWRAYGPHHVLDRDREEEFVRLTFGGLCELWYTVGLLLSNATRSCHQ